MEDKPSPPLSLPPVPKRVVAWIAASFLVLALLVAVVQLAWARHHLLDGAGRLNAAIATVRSPAALERGPAREAAIRDLETARGNFAHAVSELDLWAPALAALNDLPKYGHVLSAAAPASSAAYFASSSALDIVQGAQRLWPDLRQPRDGDLVATLEGDLDAGLSRFGLAESDASQAIADLQNVPSALGYAELQSDVDKMRRDLPRLQAASAWLHVMPSLLGASGRQRYLFCWENASEIRPAGGFIGAVDLVSLNRGHLTRRFSGSAIEQTRPPLVRLPVPEAVTTVETTWIFRDSNVSPSFPLSARLERWFYARDTGVHVDGVVDFVDQGIPDVLSATGPIYLKQYHLTVTAANAEALATRFASVHAVPYRGPLPPGSSGNLDTYRKQFLGFEFAAILHRLQTLPADRWAAVGQAMDQAIRRRDILIWSAKPDVERAVTISGADGALSTVPGDFLYIVDDNRSYNKIGPYVDESARYRADIVQGGWIDSTLTLKYHLNPSPDSMEGSGPGLGTLGNKHQFRDFVRVFVPSGSVVQSVPGLNQASPLGGVGRSLGGQSAYGLTQISGWFTINPNETKILKINYDVPANDLAFGHFHRYRLTVLRQPGSRLAGVSVNIRGVGGMRLRRPHGINWMSDFRRWLPLDSDRSVSVAIKGVGQPNLVVTPPPTSGDPLIPTKYMSGLY